MVNFIQQLKEKIAGYDERLTTISQWGISCLNFVNTVRIDDDEGKRRIERKLEFISQKLGTVLMYLQELKNGVKIYEDKMGDKAEEEETEEDEEEEEQAEDEEGEEEDGDEEEHPLPIYNNIVRQYSETLYSYFIRT